MVEFIKKNKKIILSSSIFTGISSNNIYCGCCGDTNKKNNTNNPTQNPQQNPPKDENPQQNPPTQEEIDKNKIIDECEKLIVEIKKIKPDYPKTINKDDTIENLKKFKTVLKTDLDNAKKTTPDRTPEKTEKEKLIEQFTNMIDELIKSSTENLKKMLKYVYCNGDIKKTDKELKKSMIKRYDLSDQDSEYIKNNIIPGFHDNFKEEDFKNTFKAEKIKNLDFNRIYKDVNSLEYQETLTKTNSNFRNLFFKEECKPEEDSKDDRIIIDICKDNTKPEGPIIYYYCYFNEKIYEKFSEEITNDANTIDDNLYFFCIALNKDNKIIMKNKYTDESFKYEIDENLDLIIKME